jgi:Lipocalin-like domain
MQKPCNLLRHIAQVTTPRGLGGCVAKVSHDRSVLGSASRLFLHSSAVLFLFAWGQVASADEISEKNVLIGTWLLVRYVDTPDNGEPIFAFGRKPIGHFVFTSGGHVAFSIMRNPPGVDTATSDPDPDACIPGWYCAYFGTYTVDTKRGVWTTHVLSANIPGFLNTDQPRHFKIDGNRLVVSDAYFNGSVHIKAERVFVRETPSSSHP